MNIYIVIKLISFKYSEQFRAGGISNFDTSIRYLFTTGIYAIAGCTIFSVTTVIIELQYTGILKR